MEMPRDWLGDVSPGETIYFIPGTEVTVYLPDTLPLSIFTVGIEVDQYGRVDFDYVEDERQALVEVFKDNNLNRNIHPL